MGLALAGGGFEPTAFAAAGLVIWVLIVLGLAVGVLPRSQPPSASIVAGCALAGLAALTALSLAWASDDGRAFEDVVRTLTYVGGFAAVVLASRRGEGRPWLAGLAIGLAAVASIALLARFEPSLFGNPDADLAESLPAAAGRLSYPIGYWNGLAAAMAAAIVLLSWFGARGASRGARSAAVAALPVVVLALWMTDSRGGLVAVLLAFAALVAVGPRRSALVANLALGALAGTVLILIAEGYDELLDNPVSAAAAGQGDRMLVITLALAAATYAVRRALDLRIEALVIPRRAAAAGVVAVAIAIAVTALVIDPIEQWEDFKAPPTGTELTGGDVGLLRGGGSGRYQFWETAVHAFAESPAGGVGAGDYTPYWFEHREVPIPATRAHSVLFEALAELGIVGLGLLVTFLAAAVVAGARRARLADAVGEVGPALALVIVGAAAAAVDWTWDLPAVFWITVLAAALLTGPATLPGPDPGPAALQFRGQARSRRGFAAGVVLLAVAWIAICGSGLLLLSANALESSREAAARGDVEAALESASDAVDLQPWAAEPRTQIALLYEQAGDLDRAVPAIQEAIDRSPADYRLYLLAARMEIFAENPGAARAALLTAHRLNPRDPEITRQLDELESASS